MVVVGWLGVSGFLRNRNEINDHNTGDLSPQGERTRILAMWNLLGRGKSRSSIPGCVTPCPPRMYTRTILRSFLALALLAAGPVHARTTATDGDWSSQSAVLKDTPEAEVIIRAGDIDNLGFGFPEDFNPFTGRPTEPHGFPFDPAPGDAPGTDRIMTGGGFTGKDFPAEQDGYTFDWHPQDRPLKRQTVTLPLDALKDVAVRDAVLCLFVDDFQAPTFKSRFEVRCNGVRFPEMETVLNRIDQTGPIGKVIHVKLSQEILALLGGAALAIDIDDPGSRAGDGYAVDFVKLMVNVKDFIYRGEVPGRVLDDETGEPVPGAEVDAAGLISTKADGEGAFALKRVPAGLVIVGASAKGYSAARVTVDVIGGETAEPVEIRLKRSAAVNFAGKTMREGDRVTLNRIQFDLNSAALRPEGNTELDRVAAFLKENPEIHIELSGHTSSEGSAALNHDLSFRRVRSCKEHLVRAGIDAGRLTAIGHGPDQPVAPNDTEEDRAKNRRVEMRVTRAGQP